MNPSELIDAYLAGPALLRNSVAGLSIEQLQAAPIPGKWTTQQVICHIADFEPVYADRMKRALAEQEPTVFGGDPDLFAASLAYGERDVEEELAIIECTRRQMGRILRTLEPTDFERRVIHSEAGPLTLRKLLENVTAHLPHHVKFIAEKRVSGGW